MPRGQPKVSPRTSPQNARRGFPPRGTDRSPHNVSTDSAMDMEDEMDTSTGPSETDNSFSSPPKGQSPGTRSRPLTRQPIHSVDKTDHGMRFRPRSRGSPGSSPHAGSPKAHNSPTNRRRNRNISSEDSHSPIRITKEEHKSYEEVTSWTGGTREAYGSKKEGPSPTRGKESPSPASPTANLYPSLDDLKSTEEESAPYLPFKHKPLQKGYRQSPPRIQPGFRSEEFQRGPKPSGILYGENWITLVVVISVILFAIVAWYMLAPENQSVLPKYSPMNKFNQGLKDLKEKFPLQDKRTWTVFGSAIKRIIKDEYPSQPAVILIGTARGGRPLADCLSRRLSVVVNNAYNSTEPLVIDVTSRYGSLNPGDTKIDMEDKLEKNFNGGSVSASLMGLEALDGRAAMLLHSYCDNENAPHKKAVIIFTFQVDTSDIPSTDGNPKTAERFVEESLASLWQRKLNVDDTHALLSRVANNIVIIKQEKADTLNNYC